MAATFGVLTVKNIVCTYTTHVGKAGQSSVNLPAVAVVSSGKYSRGVFPAVVSKARIGISDATPTQPDAAAVYPLHRKVKPLKSEKAAFAARNKKAKQTEHDAEQLAPRQFLTATDSQFQSGQNVVAGGTTVACNVLIAYMFVRRLNHDLHLNLRIYNMYTQNIVCGADLGFELNLEWIVQEADAKGWDVYYCPEEFSGLSWITEDNGIKVVFVIFVSGKIVATGIREMHHIAIAEERMHRMIGPFRRGNEPHTFDAQNSHMRDAKTLEVIKQQVLSNSSRQPIQAKVNAANKYSRKLTREVKLSMKQIACVLSEDGGSQELNDLSALEDLMEVAEEDVLPPRDESQQTDIDPWQCMNS